MSGADIPHCLVHFHEYSAIKSCIGIAEELKQALMLLGETHYQVVSLPRDAEHINPDKVIEHPVCCGVLYRFALFVNLEWAGVRRADLPARVVWFKDRVLPKAVLAVLEG